MWFIAVSILTFDLVHSFLEFPKISYHTFAMLTKVLKLYFYIF